jgi:hypothetical protein
LGHELSPLQLSPALAELPSRLLRGTRVYLLTEIAALLREVVELTAERDEQRKRRRQAEREVAVRDGLIEQLRGDMDEMRRK